MFKRFFLRFKVFWLIYRDPRTPWWAKVVLTVGALAYLFWPFDLIPIVLPVVGVMDDLAVVTLAGWLITRAAPAVVRRHHRQHVGLDAPSTAAPAQDAAPPPADRR